MTLLPRVSMVSTFLPNEGSPTHTKFYVFPFGFSYSISRASIPFVFEVPTTIDALHDLIADMPRLATMPPSSFIASTRPTLSGSTTRTRKECRLFMTDLDHYEHEFAHEDFVCHDAGFTRVCGSRMSPWLERPNITLLEPREHGTGVSSDH